MKKKINNKVLKIIFYILIGFCLFLGIDLFFLPDSILLLRFIEISIWGSVLTAMIVGIFLGLKFNNKISVFGLIAGSILFMSSLLILLKNKNLPFIKDEDLIIFFLVVLLLMSLGLIVGLMLGLSTKPFVNLLVLPSIKLSEKTNNLPKWIYIFLCDEEKEANLIDFRNQWYEQNSINGINKIVKIKVFVKTLHYLFVEVKIKDFIDRNIFSNLRIPRR